MVRPRKGLNPDLPTVKCKAATLPLCVVSVISVNPTPTNKE